MSARVALSGEEDPGEREKKKINPRWCGGCFYGGW